MSGNEPEGTPVLSLNCGSSSLKFGLYLCSDKAVQLILEGEAEEIGSNSSSFWTKGSEERENKLEQIAFPDHASALDRILNTLDQPGVPKPVATGHRFVHGGPKVREHRRATPALVAELRSAVDYAPLHVPSALAVLEAIETKLPDAEQVICVDTAFHRTMPDVSKTFALPKKARQLGIERYGFHGISLESILPQLEAIPEKLVVAHLGNGASITAIRDGQSIDTTMGLTPTGGVMMGTRCGDLDPGVLIYLMRHGYLDPESLEDIFDRRAGLLGVSEKTSDVRELQNTRKIDTQVDLALRMFCYQVRKAIAAMAAALGGLDMLVFTGGIGEHALGLRAEILSGLHFLGGFQALALPSQEDLQIARITARLVTKSD